MLSEIGEYGRMLDSPRIRRPDQQAPWLLPPLPVPPLLARGQRERLSSLSLPPTTAPCPVVFLGSLGLALPPLLSSFSPARYPSGRPSPKWDCRPLRPATASRAGIGWVGQTDEFKRLFQSSVRVAFRQRDTRKSSLTRREKRGEAKYASQSSKRQHSKRGVPCPWDGRPPERARTLPL